MSIMQLYLVRMIIPTHLLQPKQMRIMRHYLVLLQPLGLNGLWLNQPAATLASTIVAVVMLVRLRRELRGEA